jgi:hypothetical protein
MIDALDDLADAVSSLAKKDDNIIVLSGFDLRKPKKAVNEIVNPKNLQVFNLERSGSIKFTFDAVEHAVNYGIEIRVNGGEWQNGRYTTSPKHNTITDLQPGSYVEIRVRALGRKELASEWTAPVGIWVS